MSPLPVHAVSPVVFVCADPRVWIHMREGESEDGRGGQLQEGTWTRPTEQGQRLGARGQAAAWGPRSSFHSHLGRLLEVMRAQENRMGLGWGWDSRLTCPP